MRKYLKILFLLDFFLAIGLQPPASAAASEKRFALVIGNASYEAHGLATPANDAELIARTLKAAGFEVVHARDLKQDALRQVFSEFLEVLRKGGPDTVALVYFAGYGLQLEGENYLLPIDARIALASDVPRYGLRLTDLLQALAALRSRAAIVILDAARKSPFLLDGVSPAAGLAWLEPEANSLVAFNATPGMFAPDAANGYGPYARAVAEMINEAGLALPEIFLRARLRVHELTKGAQVPWHSARFESQFVLVERPFDQVQRSHSLEREAWLRSQAMASLGPQDAYFAALIRDTFDTYADFLADHGRDPLAKRVLAMLAARREAITWRRTCQADTPEAYWTYLERYPNGAHGTDARRRVKKLGASIVLPAKFRRVEYDIPSPLPDELDYVGQPALSLADSAFLPEPEPGLRDLIGDSPAFPFQSAAAPSPVNALPVARPTPVPSRPAELSHAAQRDSSLDFDTAQMRPSIDERPVKGNPSSTSAIVRRPDQAQPSSVAVKAELTSEPHSKAVLPAIPRALAPSVSIQLPFWADLDPPRAAIKIAGVGSFPERTGLPAWADQELAPSNRSTPSITEALWTGALTDAGSALPVPTGLAHRGRRWVMLTPDGTVPLPLARPGKLVRPWVLDRAKPAMTSVPSSSAPQTTQQTISRAASTWPAQPPQLAARYAAPKPRPANTAATSKPATAREGSPAGTSSAVTTGSR
ncbi:putative caspase-like protein [Bradyrhizobium sp. F1.4.3]|uniref:caspase family protein n=1 Tax=Bradyrhizobium sp. F1.4.3 TaxID=3156356 RepID=UPI0033955D72